MGRSNASRRVLPVLAVFLAGCVTNSGLDLPELPDWQTRQRILTAADEWQFAGRIGVSAGDEGFNGQIWWRQDGVVFRARIGGPLGAGTVFINGVDRELTLTDRDGVVTELDDAELELRQRYGWTIPVTSLRFWALGVPDPAGPAETEIDADNRLTTLRQRGWSVDIPQYRDYDGRSMPRRITAVSDDVRVRLIIDEWEFR